MAREEVKNVKGQDKVEKCGNLLPELVAVAFSFRLLTEFFDSSCYQMIQVRFRIFSIAAAMGHRYENSALDPLCRETKLA